MPITNISIEELFNLLDVNLDGELSRRELHQAAHRLGWHRYHAPLYAVLDLLTIPAPLPRATFISYMNEILHDPDGPYGRVLLHSHFFADSTPTPPTATNTPQPVEEKTGLLIIDPQHSFTTGVWKQSIGPDADIEVAPIRRAFDNVARMLGKTHGRVETMFTRCPFPPDSYSWDEKAGAVLDDSQPYFVKPGNSVMWPPTNGFREWVERLLARDRTTLVMGGCTLNSCVRVSAIDTMGFFKDRGLRVVVDLSISGARESNYTASPQYGGLSSVESAVEQMRAAGVRVVRGTAWSMEAAK